ncbi:MAG TPA: acyltransferase [Dongiaceae bacterium]|nr:acyltransferase [Dongiaceae bacterium]
MDPVVFLYDLMAKARRVIKRSIIKRKFGKCGKRFKFDPDGTFLRPNLIDIGDDVFIGEKAHFSASEGIRIGNSVMFGPYPMIIGGDHNFSVVGKRMADIHEGGINKPVIIEDDVWFGARVLILKGVTVGEGAIVGAGSIVTKDIPPYAIAVGSPCRPCKTRFTRELLQEHLAKVGSRLSVKDIIEAWKRCNIISE